jgi:flagellar hook-length control protein FliK
LSAAAGAAAQPTLQNGGVAKPAPLSTSATGRTPSISAKAGPGKSLGGASSVAQAGAATLDQVDTASIDAGVVGDRGQKDDAGDGAASSQSQPTGDAAAAPTGAPPDASALAGPLQAQAAAAAQSAAPKADVRTVSQLSAQIVQTVNGNKTSFDMTLHPEGLGDVQVKVSVDHNGAVTASMNFSDPHAAAELGARAGDLRDALAQAGFTVADNGLSFNLGGQGQPGSGQGGWSEGANPNGGRAFLAARDNSEDLLAAVSQAAARLQRPSAAGLDIRI